MFPNQRLLQLLKLILKTMNKKLLLLMFVSLFALVLQAQTEHMKFAGIPLTGTIDQFQKKLVAKGFRLNKTMYNHIQEDKNILYLCHYIKEILWHSKN